MNPVWVEMGKLKGTGISGPILPFIELPTPCRMESMSENAMPSRAETVVIGGGIVGCSVAYHLAQMGHRDVLLLEQNQLGSGTTWHAAGMIGRLRTSNSLTEINRYSAELYSRLFEETGHDIGWKEVGSLIVAQSEDRLVQLKRTVSMARYFGIEADIISAAEAGAKWPLMETKDLLGAAWLPHDGKVIPGEVPKALARGAESMGVVVREGVRVAGLRREGVRVVGVQTSLGDVECQNVVLAGGMWTRQFGLKHGVDLPLWPVEHHYVVTHPIEGCHDGLPLGRDPDGTIYFRGEGNGIMLGAFQADSKPWEVEAVPDDFSFQLFEPDWERYQRPLAAARKRLPVFEEIEFEKFVNGPESFTPDNNFLLGEIPQIGGLFVAAGFNSVGIASAGGAGRCLAAWIVEGAPPMDLWSVDVRRFGSWANQEDFLKSRVREVLGLHYRMAWPNLEFETGRNVKGSPIHDQLVEANASFGAKAGWERPNWFALPGESTEVEYSFQKQNWFAHQEREHRAAREHIALFDQSSFGKLEVRGGGAASFLQRLCANDVDVEPGRVVYTALLNERGGYESDLTVVRRSEDHFYLVTGTAQLERDRSWLESHLEVGGAVTIADVTRQYGVLSVMGPRARDFLQGLADTSLESEAFPFGSARSIQVGSTGVLAIRMTYVGELGWELHVPWSEAGTLYRTLRGEGRTDAPVLAGHYAIQSLRLEKAYRAWGADLCPDDNPFEAGLSFAVDFGCGEFLGRAALERIREELPARRLLQFVLVEPEPVLWGNEPVIRDGQVVGYTSSGAYGHSLQASVGLGYVADPKRIHSGDWLAGHYEIEVNGRCHTATPHLRPAFDPGRKKVR